MDITFEAIFVVIIGVALLILNLMYQNSVKISSVNKISTLNDFIIKIKKYS